MAAPSAVIAKKQEKQEAESPLKVKKRSSELLIPLKKKLPVTDKTREASFSKEELTSAKTATKEQQDPSELATVNEMYEVSSHKEEVPSVTGDEQESHNVKN